MLRRYKRTTDLLLGGKSENYREITEKGLLSSGEVPVEGNSIEQRMGYHMVAARELAVAFGEMNPDRPITIIGMPSYEEIQEKGLGGILKSIN